MEHEIQMPEIRRSDRSRTAQEAGSGEAKCNNAGGYGEYFDTHEMIGITLIERRGIPFSSSDEGRTKAERHGPGCRNAVAKYTSPSYAGAVEGVSGVSVVKGQYVPLRHVRVSGVRRRCSIVRRQSMHAHYSSSTRAVSVVGCRDGGAWTRAFAAIADDR